MKSSWKAFAFVAALATGAIVFLQQSRPAQAASPTASALHKLQDVQV